MRVADYVADFIYNQGTTHVFLLSGGGMMHLLDAVGCHKGLKVICSHHEQASGMAADGYARLSGKLGVCYATSGPGGTNTLTAVVGAYQDSSPVLFISGQSKVSQTIRGSGLKGLRQFGTFEVDVLSSVGDFTKYSAFVSDSKMIRYHLEKALFLAFEGRPGPVFLDIPVDVQGAKINPDTLVSFDPTKEGYFKKQSLAEELAIQGQVEQILELMIQSKRPVMLGGYGIRVAGQVKNFENFINDLNLPSVTTSFGIDLLPFDHQNFVGHPGMKGDRAGNFAVQGADFVLSLGSSLHVTTTGYELERFAPKATKVLVDLDQMVLKREGVGCQIKLQLDVKTFFVMAKSWINKNASKLDKFKSEILSWRTQCQSWKSHFLVYREPHSVQGDQIDYYRFFEQLDQKLGQSDVIISDAGSAFYVVGQALRVKSGQRVINSGSLGAMGFAVPASTGAACADPSKRIVCVTGDGSLQTNVHELGTITKNNLNVKLFVVNNGGYVCIRNTQNNFFEGRFVGTDAASGVFIPELKKLADAYNFTFYSVSSYAELDGVLDKVLSNVGPVFCEIIAPSAQEIIPTVSSVKNADGSMTSKPLDEMYPFLAANVAMGT